MPSAGDEAVLPPVKARSANPTPESDAVLDEELVAAIAAVGPFRPSAVLSSIAASMTQYPEADDADQSVNPHSTDAGGVIAGHRTGQQRRKLFTVGAGIVTAGVVAVLAYAVWPDQPPASQGATASYDAPVAHYSDGLAIRTTWTLGGADGVSLTEKITASDTNSASLSVQYRESVPVAVLTQLAAARFTPSVPMITDDGRGLVWPLHLKAGGQAVVSYQVTIAGLGVSQARLTMLLREFTAVPLGPVLLKSPSVTLQTMTIIPKSLRLRVGRTEHLSLVGRLSNGKVAAPTYLASVRWTTADRHVAIVNSFGKVTAVAPGNIKIIATVGKLHTFIYVDVSNSAGAGAGATQYTPTYTPPSTGASSPPATHSTTPPTTPITTTPHTI